MLSVIIVAVIGASCIAGIRGCLLANITVYPNGPCPSYGVMNYYGKNDTYFNCTPGTQTDATLFTDSATCFRWIARDTTTNDVTTQLGVCTGLIHAFCAATFSPLYLMNTSTDSCWAAAAFSINQTKNTTERKQGSNKTKYIYELPVNLRMLFLAHIFLLTI